MSEHYYPPRGAVKKVVPVNAAFTSAGSRTEVTYEVALTQTVDPAKSAFIGTGEANSRYFQGPGSNVYILNHGIALKGDGTALQIYAHDTYAGTYRIIGVVVEYY